jgi:site-specific DNA-adenine methylase
MTEQLVAPFPWFGGKRVVADEVWRRLGSVENYVEPFAGSLAVLLAKSDPAKCETVNDLNGFLANFWRAVSANPEAVAHHADWPVNEVDLQARHWWLVTEGACALKSILGEPHGYDAKIAGWWLWGACAWIGSGWCSGEGPWQWTGDEWVSRNAGMGINRQLPHVGNAGMGINRQLPHVGDAGRGEFIREWMAALSDRLRNVRVAHGDWARVCGPSVTFRHGLTGVFLDPPYSAEDRAEVYSNDDFNVAREARAWAIENGSNRLMRIAFCGYAGEFNDPWPAGWTQWQWKARGGYGSQGDETGRANAARERIWFSPHCIPVDDRPGLLALMEVA